VQHRAAETVSDANGLARAVSVLLNDQRLQAERAAAGKRVTAASSDILDTVLMRLAPWLDRLAPLAGHADPSQRMRA